MAIIDKKITFTPKLEVELNGRLRDENEKGEETTVLEKLKNETNNNCTRFDNSAARNGTS